MGSSLSQFLRKFRRGWFTHQLCEPVGRPVKQCSVLGYDPVELVEHVADALQVGQLPAGHHQQSAARGTKTIERAGSRISQHTVMRQSSIVVAGQDMPFHSYNSQLMPI